MRGGSHGTNVHHDFDDGTQRMTKAPILVSKWFYDTSIGTALEKPVVVHCWMGLSLLSSQLWMKQGGHEDLCGSGHRSVAPYVHGMRVVLLCVLQARVHLA
jgi:hypothetical protein